MWDFPGSIYQVPYLHRELYELFDVEENGRLNRYSNKGPAVRTWITEHELEIFGGYNHEDFELD